MNNNTATINNKGVSLDVESKGLRKLGAIQIPDYFWDRTLTGIPVLDDVINGDGIVPGQCFTLAAPRGSGKTTLLLQLMQALVTNNKGYKAAYLSGEEIVEQLAFNSARFGAADVTADNITNVDEIANVIASHQMVVIDSTSSMKHPDYSGERMLEEYACNTLIRAAKQAKCATFFIQHFTKGGQEKGGSLWGHNVDTCIKLHKLDIEEYGENARLVEVEKNRFGTSAEMFLRLTREGFDFANPIEVKANGNAASKGGNNRVNVKLHEMRQILEIVKTKSNARLADMSTVCDDMARIERLCKELEKSGKLVRMGRGTQAYYTLGDIDDDAEGISS